MSITDEELDKWENDYRLIVERWDHPCKTEQVNVTFDNIPRLIAEVRALHGELFDCGAKLTNANRQIEEQRQEIERLKRKQPWRVGEYDLSRPL